MGTFLSAVKKHAAQKEILQQYAPVRWPSFLLRAFRKNYKTIHIPILRCSTTHTTDTKMALSFVSRFPRNTDRTTNQSKVDITRPILSDPRGTQTGSEGTSSSSTDPATTVPAVADYATSVQHGTKNICSYQVYTIPIIRRQGALLLEGSFFETLWQYMRVLVVRNNPNFPGMERGEGLFVRMRFSHPFCTSFTRSTSIAQLARKLLRRCFTIMYIISVSASTISRKIWKCYPR